jgi:hypothetical protein
MSKIITILALIFLGTISLDAYAAQDAQDAPVKHRLHDKVKAKPVRNQEWYLQQIRESDRFKAIALESDDAKSATVDHLVQQTTISDQPIVETEGVAKIDPSKFNFMFVPPFINHKLMDLQSRPDVYPTFMMTWNE